jgi:hypothetical protein
VFRVDDPAFALRNHAPTRKVCEDISVTRDTAHVELAREAIVDAAVVGAPFGRAELEAILFEPATDRESLPMFSVGPKLDTRSPLVKEVEREGDHDARLWEVLFLPAIARALTVGRSISEDGVLALSVDCTRSHRWSLPDLAR